jgi:ATP-binding cassette subfamily C protein CydC
LSQQLLTEQAAMSRYHGLSQAVLSLSANIALILALLVVIPLVSRGELSSSVLPMIALFTLASFEAVLSLPFAFQTLPETIIAARRIFAIVDAKPLVIEPETDSPEAKHADIEFKHVSFLYPSRKPSRNPSQINNDLRDLVLDKLSFKLLSGERLGVVGNSGTGKSSIVHLLLRFWAPSSGDIYFGGHNIKYYKGDDIRRYFSVVTQHSTFFNSTIKRNLLIARRDASDEQLADVCRIAQIHDFIESLPEGYDTWVGEAGLKLSGGQLKRLSIARALLKEAPVLILDEPGEGLDSQTEKALLDAVFDYKNECSILLITHKQTGLDLMDNIIVLDDKPELYN